MEITTSLLISIFDLDIVLAQPANKMLPSLACLYARVIAKNVLPHVHIARAMRLVKIGITHNAG